MGYTVFPVIRCVNCIMLLSFGLAASSLLVNRGLDVNVKFAFYHITTEVVASSLPDPYQRLEPYEVSASSILECSVRCLASVECLMFGVQDATDLGSNSPKRCVIALPSSTGTVSFGNGVPSSGIYVRNNPETPEDCSDIQNAGIIDNGPFWIYPKAKNNWVRVFCDFSTDGGGWTVFQKRRYGNEDFYQNWATYKKGFGNINKDFWLGNDNLHILTSQGSYQMRVDLWDFSGNYAFAMFSNVQIGNEANKYKLTLGPYLTGSNASDSLYNCRNGYFSTKDRDNDGSGYHCAQLRQGGYWYIACCRSNLNSPWLNSTTRMTEVAVTWYLWKNKWAPLMSEMKIRPASWNSN